MLATATAAVIAVGAVGIGGSEAAAAPARAGLCARYGSVVVQHRYVVQANHWGDATAQCLATTDGGFAITRSDADRPTAGPPAGYPSIYYGWHYGAGSPGTALPVRADSPMFPTIRTSVAMRYPDAGIWNASYDIWFDPTPRRAGANTGLEVMVWVNRRGPIQPAGAKVGTVRLLGVEWDVWHGKGVLTYLRHSPTATTTFAVTTFFADAVRRGYAETSWYLTSIQAGFEPWVGGTGLAVTAFTVTTTIRATTATTAPKPSTSIKQSATIEPAAANSRPPKPAPAPRPPRHQPRGRPLETARESGQKHACPEGRRHGHGSKGYRPNPRHHGNPGHHGNPRHDHGRPLRTRGESSGESSGESRGESRHG